MSTLQDETKDIEKKETRRGGLKDVDVSLRDQIPEKLAKKLEELNIGRKIVEMWAIGTANRQEWLDRQEEYLKDWDEFLESTAEGPFTGSSTLHIPMPLVAARTMHARFMQALFSVEPYFTTKPRREDAVERARMVQDFMGWTLKEWINYNQGIEDTADQWIWNWITTGSGILKGMWDAKYTSFVDVIQEQKVSYKTVVDPSTGNEVQVPVVGIEEKEQRITKKLFEGPVYDLRMNEDVLIVGGDGDPQKADAVLERYYETASDLWTLADRKIFRKDAVEDVIEGGPDQQSGSEGNTIKQRRMENANTASLDVDYDLDRYEIIEAYLKVDVDGSGINSDVVVWIHKKSKKILRATYLHRINKSGKRPYFKIFFHKRQSQSEGVGLIEMMHPLSKELDAVHNIAVDYGMLSTMPFGFYRPTASLDPEVIQLEPGALIPLDNPQADVYFPNLGNRAVFNLQQEAAIFGYIERLVGLSDINYGIQSGNQGATRTATGARVLASENNTNLDVLLRRLNRGWKDVLEYLLNMLQQRVPPGLSFRVTGEAGNDYWSYIRSQDDIIGDFDFELSPNSSASNRLIQQDQAVQVYQFVQNPLLIQAGIVSTSNIYEAAKNYLRALGIKDYSKFCTKPADSQQYLTPEEEANRVLRDIEVPVTPEMDHEGYINYWKEIEATDELLGQFDQQQTLKLAAQAQRHVAMLEALQRAAAQVRNTQQARENAQNNQLAAAQPASPAAQPEGIPQ